MSVEFEPETIEKLMQQSIQSNIKLAGGQVKLADLVSRMFLVGTPVSQSAISKWLNKANQTKTYHLLRTAIGDSSLWKDELSKDNQISLINHFDFIPSYHCFITYSNEVMLFDGVLEFRRELLLSLVTCEGKQVMAGLDEVSVLDWEKINKIEG